MPAAMNRWSLQSGAWRRPKRLAAAVGPGHRGQMNSTFRSEPPAAAARPPVDRAAIADEMDEARGRLHALLAAADAEDLRRASEGTRWTNEQLLFHMVFGYLVVRTLLPLVRVVSRLPAPVGRGWAALLNSATRPFHVVNYWGSVGAARVFNHARMGPLADRTIAALQRRLAREPEAALHRGMPFPTRWDPYFGYLELAEVYRYPTRHFEHHRRQLSFPGDS
jgi:hypothetical protein